jgi:hypothetical protein
MKKLAIISALAFSLSIVACKNEEPMTEEVSVEQGIQQMTEAIADTNAVVAVSDSAK